MSTTKGTLFVKEVLNRLTGNNDEAKANKIARKAITAIEGQIASLKAKVVDDEIAVESAEERLADAKYPTEVFTDNKAYCQNIVNAQNTLEATQETLADTQKTIKFFEDLLETY